MPPDAHADRTARLDAASLLAQTQLFGAMPPAGLRRLAARAVGRIYRRGEIIFHEQDIGDALYIVAEGLVKVYVTSPAGEDLLLVTLGPSAVFGELPLVDGGLRSASAAAVERTTLVTLTRAALLEALSSDVLLVDSLLRTLGSLVRRLTDQAADLVFLDLHGRVAKLLLEMAQRSGEIDEGTITFELAVTQSELADMVGSSRQSVNQVLQSYQRLGYLTINGRRLIIGNPEPLRRRAGLSASPGP